MPNPKKKEEIQKKQQLIEYIYCSVRIANSRRTICIAFLTRVSFKRFLNADTLNGFAAECRISQCAENLAAKNG